MRRMAYTFLSGMGSVVVLDSVAAVVVDDALLPIMPVADFLPPDVGFHFDEELSSEEGHDCLPPVV